MIDYDSLRLAWWLLLGVWLAAFALIDGLNLGLGVALPLIARTDVERRALIGVSNRDGHQAWFVLAGAAVFAAWPLLYAGGSPGFGIVIVLVVLTLFLRPVGFALRHRLTSARGRSAWDWVLIACAVVPAFAFGVVFGNLFLGVPFHFADTMSPIYEGTFAGLLKPFALLTGVVSLAMLLMHGACYAAMRLEDPLAARARRVARIGACVASASFIGCGIWLLGILGPSIISPFSPNALSDPLRKDVLLSAGAWWIRHRQMPLTLVFPLAALLGCLGVALLRARRGAFACSTVAVAAVVFTAGIALFPFLLPSSTHPSHGLTVWDASSDERTLFLLLVAMVFLFPLVLAYTSWALRVTHGLPRE
jgi:cytochrome d ubiquinol oxidase subunit II